MPVLYVVATPIGNLEDISLRAIRTLREVRLIAAEDTRRTKRLLVTYHIKTPLTSYHEHNKRAKLAYILSRLEEGDVALVSDAGTPSQARYSSFFDKPVSLATMAIASLADTPD